MCDSCGLKGAVHRPTLDRRGALALGLGVMASAAAPFRALAEASDKPPPKPENVVSPGEALDRLMESNARYVSGIARRHDFVAGREALIRGQNPYAGILSCADSRVVPEFAFDSAPGDLFTCRVAGNVVNPDNLASFEYAVDVLKTPLIMVLGHESCGAIKATISAIVDKATLRGHLPALVAGIRPAVEAVVNQPGDRLLNATKENIRRNVAKLKGAEPIVSAAVSEGRVQVVGGLYRLETGRVELI
ncbi:MAG: carbonic anhydrase [Hyphomicrobiales bacterium]|nr:carbonic anhydrase [Hyphomicrobiales bacterium]